MQFTNQLPPKVTPFRKLDFTRDSSSYLMVNIMMALTLLLFYYIFSLFINNMLPGFEGAALGGFSFWEIMIVLIMSFVMMFLHEGIHFAAYKVVTGIKPDFSAKSANPHTRMPGIYFNKGIFIVLKLVPLVLLTALFLLTAPIVPMSWMTYFIFFFAGNAAFSSSDLIAISQVLRIRGKVYVEDLSDVVILYTQED